MLSSRVRNLGAQLVLQFTWESLSVLTKLLMTDEIESGFLKNNNNLGNPKIPK